jgi:hypothetical protein
MLPAWFLSRIVCFSSMKGRDTLSKENSFIAGPHPKAGPSIVAPEKDHAAHLQEDHEQAKVLDVRNVTHQDGNMGSGQQQLAQELYTMRQTMSCPA